MERMEARVRKSHPVLPEPDLQPHQVVAEEKTNMLVVFSPAVLVRTVFMLVVFVLLYGGIVTATPPTRRCSSPKPAGTVPASSFPNGLGGLAAAGVYALNACSATGSSAGPWSWPAPSCSPAAGWACTSCTTPRPWSSSTSPSDRRGHLPVEHVRVRAAELPDPDARAGYRVDRRHGPPGRLGWCPALRAHLHGGLAVRVDPAGHDPGRAAARRHDRVLRDTPAPPRARRTGPIDLGRRE